MRILYDQQIFSEQEYGGISRYFVSLARTLNGEGLRAQVLAPLHVNGYLSTLDRGVVTGIKVRPVKGTRRAIKAGSAALFATMARWIRPDIIHASYYEPTGGTCPATPRVLTIFDMIHERCPDSFAAGDRTAALKAEAVRRAAHIFCISESTKHDLLDLLPVPEHKISVTYLAADELPPPAAVDHPVLRQRPFLLHVGGRHGYKNFERALQAYAASAWLRRTFALACFGGGILTGAERQAISRAGLGEEQVVQLGGDDRILSALYGQAAALIYPSLYEGFGIPPLEAMSRGCPVLCSRSSSLPEVVGDAGITFDPASVDDIRFTLERVLGSPETLAALRERGFARHRLFTWRKCADQTMAGYRRVLG